MVSCSDNVRAGRRRNPREGCQTLRPRRCQHLRHPRARFNAKAQRRGATTQVQPQRHDEHREMPLRGASVSIVSLWFNSVRRLDCAPAPWCPCVHAPEPETPVTALLPSASALLRPAKPLLLAGTGLLPLGMECCGLGGRCCHLGVDCYRLRGRCYALGRWCYRLRGHCYALGHHCYRLGRQCYGLGGHCYDLQVPFQTLLCGFRRLGSKLRLSVIKRDSWTARRHSGRGHPATNAAFLPHPASPAGRGERFAARPGTRTRQLAVVRPA
jgi:hypothetical protein